jgi:predicted N-acyltransferase
MDAELSISVATGLSDVSAREWNALAGPDNPFLCHAFLSSLEEAGCVGRRTGWSPAHLIVTRPGGSMVAAAPVLSEIPFSGRICLRRGLGGRL